MCYYIFNNSRNYILIVFVYLNIYQHHLKHVKENSNKCLMCWYKIKRCSKKQMLQTKQTRAGLRAPWQHGLQSTVTTTRHTHKKYRTLNVNILYVSVLFKQIYPLTDFDPPPGLEVRSKTSIGVETSFPHMQTSHSSRTI